MKFLILRVSAALIFTLAFVSYSRVKSEVPEEPVFERVAPKTRIELQGHDQFIHHPALERLERRMGPYRAPTAS